MLSRFRVIDLSDERGQLAGLMLAMLGADVLAVEPAGGSGSRRVPPFAPGVPALEGSLWHWAYNRGKRSVELDLMNPGADRDRFAGLLAGADVLIESASPGELAGWGIDLAELQVMHPHLVVVSVSAFGRSGPKAGWPATDLIAEASACELYLTGDQDRAPVRVSVPQGYLNAAADAACGALVALAERDRSGAGQHVDASAQESCAFITQGQLLAAPYRTPTPLRRNGAGVAAGPVKLRWVYRAADGHVTITLLFGPHARFALRLLQWMVEVGELDAAELERDWTNVVSDVIEGRVAAGFLEGLQVTIDRFTSTRTKADLLAGALERGVLMAPVSSIAEILASEQFIFRGYWDEVEHPELSRVLRYPGPFTLKTGTPLRRLGRPPSLGEHTVDVLKETARQPGILVDAGVAKTAAPLVGTKVLDLTWFMAGPSTTRMLADWGATVVRVESVRRPDGGRGSGPFLDGKATPDSGGYPLTNNAGKLGLALDLSRPEARPVLEDLIRWADVVVVNYSRRACRSMGLDHATLAALNPKLINVSSCLMGQTGPLADFAGFGNLSAALAGFYEIGGWPDRPPIGPYLAYTDVLAPRFTFCVILAALEERRRTGSGCHIDLSQAESSIQLLAPVVLEHQLTGAIPGRHGNDDLRYAPHGVYPCAGEDSWLAVACADDDAWLRLCAVIGRADLAADQSLRSAAGRLRKVRDLDPEIAAWTTVRTGAEAETLLVDAGIAAHRVLDSAGCWADPQLAHRGHYRTVAHPIHGEVVIQGPRLSLSRSACSTVRAAPPIGEDTFEVLQDLLGYDIDHIAELAAAEALE